MLVLPASWLENSRKNGRLAIGLNLLFETLIAGWVGFFGLYTLEVLLPTFITSRLSLPAFFVVLVGGSALLSLLAEHSPARSVHFRSAGRVLIALVLLWSFALVALSLYRFPFWSIPLQIGGFAAIVFLFFRWQKENSDTA
jgi:hypothetical protein